MPRGRDSRSRSRGRGGGRGGGVDEDRIQQMVDDRQKARRSREFDRADDLRDQLRGMGVNVDDIGLTWKGPDGMEGKVSIGYGGGAGGQERRDGDWDCPKCGAMIFASKSSCFKCGHVKGSDRGRRNDSRDRGGRGRGRRDDSRDDRRRSRRDSRDRRR
eukprot:TRINITY_DN16643_c1_g1_i1.p2 TRINITY_DN16643_c1_g1~~TRINITY_DN16643_c1_g1_i1.p2  ORF type:complete len:159 (+),score=38.24 TRINITY_DN16643_c1_g1_i1:137-613(+)